MLTAQQADLLNELAACAERYRCISGLHLFGSFGRGDAHPASDIDLFVLYSDARDTLAFIDSFTDWQDESEAWATDLSERFGHPVHIHGAYLSDPPDAAFLSVVAALKNPIAAKGKSAILWTEKVE